MTTQLLSIELDATQAEALQAALIGPDITDETLRDIFPGNDTFRDHPANVLACIDRRMILPVVLWATQRFGHGNFYLTLIPGGALNIGQVIEGLRLAIKKGATGGIYLFAHDDCKALEAEGLADVDEIAVLQTAEQICELRFPNTPASVFVMHLNYQVEDVSATR